MADPSFESDVLRSLLEQATAIGRVAKNDDVFMAAYKAFRAQDRNAFNAALKRLRPAPQCGLVCEWIRIKECVFLCLELCGPPPATTAAPDPRALAQAIARITENPRLVAQLVKIVENRDRAAYKRFVTTQELGAFSHFFCHWVCLVRYRLICNWICDPKAAEPPKLAAELQAAGKAIRALVAKPAAFKAAVTASKAGDAAKLQSVIAGAGLVPLCRWICEFFCSWRCVLACFTLCRQFPLTAIEDEPKEALAFAKAVGALPQHEAELGKLSAAVGAGNAKDFAAVLGQLELRPFCLQLCHWICFLRCRLFCIRVCPPLQCAITDPTGCTKEEPDPVAGVMRVRVHGTAAGANFGHYTLQIQSDGDPPIAGIVSYPGGGATGTSQVVAGELGRIDTTSLSDGAYTITLTVFPAGPGANCVKTTTFNLLKVAVYITRIAGVPAVPSCYDPNAELVSGMHIRSFGGSLEIDGAAYVFGCAAEKIARYEIRQARVAAPGPGPGQPATDAAVPADWPPANQIHAPLVYDPTKYWPWTRVGPIPTNLLNDWGTKHVGAPSPGGTDYPILQPTSWDSRGATGNPGGGRYALLLIVEDTAAHRYFDLQRIWVDNWPVLCQIVKFQKPGTPPGTWDDLPTCTDILLSWKKLRIVGLAWDALIDSAWPTTGPNDNFDRYGLSYVKQFVAVSDPIPVASPTTRVPNFLSPTPTVADAAVLAEWDLTTLDAGAKPAGATCSSPIPAPNQNRLYRKCSCTYSLTLGVSDTTVTQTVSDYGLHHPSTTIPIKIVNDL